MRLNIQLNIANFCLVLKKVYRFLLNTDISLQTFERNISKN